MLTCGFSSTFTLPTLTFPSYSFDSSSITGPIARQGPHHSAQKSITANLSDSKTCSLKFASVNSCAMFIILEFIFIVVDTGYWIFDPGYESLFAMLKDPASSNQYQES